VNELDGTSRRDRTCSNRSLKSVHVRITRSDGIRPDRFTVRPDDNNVIVRCSSSHRHRMYTMEHVNQSQLLFDVSHDVSCRRQSFVFER
jgi:hypothetical protein